MKLNYNIGWLDKLVRYGISAILISLHLSGTVTGTMGLLTLGVAVIFLATGIFRFCPIYYALGFTTCKTAVRRGKYE